MGKQTNTKTETATKKATTPTVEELQARLEAVQAQYDLMHETHVAPIHAESARVSAMHEMLKKLASTFNENEEDSISVLATLQEATKFLEADGMKEPLLVERELNGFRQITLWALAHRRELGIGTNEHGLTSSFGRIKEESLPEGLRKYHASYTRCHLASEGQKVIHKAETAFRKKIVKTLSDYSDLDFVPPVKKK